MLLCVGCAQHAAFRRRHASGARSVGDKPGRVGSWLACGFVPHDRRTAALFCLRQIPSIPERKFPRVANIKSQIKRNKTNEKAQARNKAVKSELKTLVRNTREAIAKGDKTAAEATLRVASKKLDKAVSKGVVHENQAANRKSSLAKQVAAL